MFFLTHYPVGFEIQVSQVVIIMFSGHRTDGKACNESYYLGEVFSQ